MKIHHPLILVVGGVLGVAVSGCGPSDGRNSGSATNNPSMGGSTNVSVIPTNSLRNTVTNVAGDARTMLTNAARTILATAVLAPASGSSVQGTVNFVQVGDQVRVEGTFTGLTPGQHGFHIHEKGDCSAPDASSAGGHFNPSGAQHGGPGDATRHVGDFGNLVADAQGNANFLNTFADLKFDGPDSIVGKAMIVHAKADDLKTQPTGDAGGRVACGVIQRK